MNASGDQKASRNCGCKPLKHMERETGLEARDVQLGKTLADRFLSVTAFTEDHRSARGFPSFRETVANGVATESRPFAC